MARYKLDPTAELSSNFANGETWRVKPDSNGVIDCKDADLDVVLAALADDPAHILEHVKAKG